jgi:FKBP-type peptidyl-prolyl cis-trans isomerase FklB
MKFRNIIWCLLAVLALASCKEEDDAVEEYANWQATNDTFFSNLVSDTQQKIDKGQTNWSLLPCYTMPEQYYTFSYSDYVVVEKLVQGAGTTSPLQTDSVTVHYQGRLLPSASYARGYIFDQSYAGTFDPITATPSKFVAGSLVKGFSTALMHMHRGDRWCIYIPYQLAYGSATRNGIPAYSTLIFELQLEDFWRKTLGDRD